MKSLFTKSIGLLILLMIVLNPKTSIAGASYGLTVWFRTILPTLLPFMIVVRLIMRLDCVPFSNPLVFPVLIGLLSGFPMGAKVIADEVLDGSLSRTQGQFLLSFCNLPSPMFLGGVVALPGILISTYLPIPLLMLLAFLRYRPVLSIKKIRASTVQTHDWQGLTLSVFESDMMECFLLITKIGGYMMLFSILAFFLQKLSHLPTVLSTGLTGMLELTTGVSMLASSDLSTHISRLLAAGLCSFGGMCIFMQTKSVTEKACLSAKAYLAWKLLHMTLSMIVMYLFLF